MGGCEAARRADFSALAELRLCLACSARLPTGLYVPLALISFFFNDFLETSLSTGSIFVNFTPTCRYFIAD